MNNSIKEDLEKIERLNIRSEYRQVLPLIEELYKSKNLTMEEKIKIDISKIRALIDKGKVEYKLSIFQECLKLSEDIINESKNLNNKLLEFDSYIIKSQLLTRLNYWEEYDNVLQNVENLLTLIKNEYASSTPTIEIIVKEADVLYLKGVILDYRFFRAQDFSKKDNEEAEKLILKALEIYRRTSRKYKITECCEILVNMYIYSNDDLTLKYLEEGLRTSLEINNDLMISQFFRQYAVYHYSKGDIPQFLNYSKKMKEIYQRIDDKVGLGIAYRYVGEFYKLTNKWEEAYQELQKSYDIFKETDHNLEFAATQESLGDLFKIQGDLRKALKYYNQAHQLIADLNQYPWFVIENIAEIYFLMGDVDRSLDMHKELMERYEARSQKKGISDNLCKLGRIYAHKGEFEQALNHLERSFILREEFENDLETSWSLFYLIETYLQINENEKAVKYLKKLEEKRNKNEETLIKTLYSLAEAYLIKSEKTPSKLEKAEKLLKEIILRKHTPSELVASAILTLCEILLEKLYDKEEQNIIGDLREHIDRLYQLGTKDLAYPWLIEAIWLHAQLALIDSDTNRAKRLFYNAQSFAEEKGLKGLAIRISNNYDNLLDKLEQWEVFTQKLPTIAEKMELTHIEIMLEQIMRSKGSYSPETEVGTEIPKLIAIFSQSGRILLTEQLNSLDDQFTSQILKSIIRNEYDEYEKESIQRFRYKHLTYLRRRIEPLDFCYVFEGKSFPGINKIHEFTNVIRRALPIWEALLYRVHSGENLGYSEKQMISEFIDNIIRSDIH